MRKAALAGVRWEAEMIRSPSFSRDSESRTTMGSPRAGKGNVRGEFFWAGREGLRERMWWTYRMLRLLRGWC